MSQIADITIKKNGQIGILIEDAEYDDDYGRDAKTTAEAVISKQQAYEMMEQLVRVIANDNTQGKTDGDVIYSDVVVIRLLKVLDEIKQEEALHGVVKWRLDSVRPMLEECLAGSTSEAVRDAEDDWLKSQMAVKQTP